MKVGSEHEPHINPSDIVACLCKLPLILQWDLRFIGLAGMHFTEASGQDAKSENLRPAGFKQCKIPDCSIIAVVVVVVILFDSIIYTNS